MLGADHMKPLVEYVARLRLRHPEWQVPDFDPADGGTKASILFLAEKPGPMTDPERPGARKGSGFVSLDNDDPTAETGFTFMAQAGIARCQIVKWNVVPWWDGTRKIRARDLHSGVAEIRELIGLLKRPLGVVLVGNKAQRAKPLLQGSGLRVFCSTHPSPIVKASNRAKWDQIPEQWRTAALELGLPRCP